ncbi:hypothetical protein BGY98DRAFT_130080 [Russula aff. rugulosa BPL654]|nr:hypothetical protein BGY98DRAFT_130080 [Russula aff. rugulosa BPL654]
MAVSTPVQRKKADKTRNLNSCLTNELTPAHCLIDHHPISTSFSAVIHFVLVLGAHPINTRNSSVKLTACRSKSCMCKLHVRFSGATINVGLLPCLLSESRGTRACSGRLHAMHHLQALACNLSISMHPIARGVSSGFCHAYLESQSQPTVRNAVPPPHGSVLLQGGTALTMLLASWVLESFP